MRGVAGGGVEEVTCLICIHVNILTVMDRMTAVANGTKQ